MIWYYISIAVFLILLLFIISFLLVRRYVLGMLDKKITNYQNDLVTKHCNEVENMYKQVRGWRHDYHNHIQAMKMYVSMGQVKELEEYLSMLDHDLTTVDTVIKTGNVMIDAILNSKLALATNKQIKINAKAYIPKEISISAVDLCVIIGNLLDNAMEACLKQMNPEDRFIRVYIDVLKGKFYLCVTNSVGGQTLKEGGKYVTTKDSNHGFGLMRVDKIVEKYSGYVNRQHEEGAFATEIILPI